MKYFVWAMIASGASLLPLRRPAPAAATLFQHANLIDGTGGVVIRNADIRVQGGLITAIGAGLPVSGATVKDLSGKFVMPELISCHAHVGMLKGTESKAENYTRANILAQLNKYASYGVSDVLVMGSDRPMLFASGLRDSSEAGLIAGARLHSAGYGFGVPGNAPPGSGMNQVLRPASAEEVPALIDSVARVHPALIKMWVDDFGGRFRKMDPAVYQAVIREAHARGLRVAAHLYYLSDARKLVAAGLDIMAHSIRDSVIDEVLLREMKKKNVHYIPTLSLDEYAYIYARRPEWIDDAFFKASLEPGVYEMITSEKYQQDLKNAPDFERNRKAFETALQNLKKIFDAGIVVCLGTDSGATPLRAQGFSEHLELELMVQAGLSPMQAITAATRNAAQLLRIDRACGTLQKGKQANFIVLANDPLQNIKNSRSIEGVYQQGILVSNGPVQR